MKKTTAAFTITAAVMSLLTLWLSFGICDMICAPDEVFPHTEESVYFDGTDFTGIINAGISVSNNVINFIAVMIALICFSLLLTAAALVVWAVFGGVLRKKAPAVLHKGRGFFRKGFLLAMLCTDAAVLIMDTVYSIIGGNGCCFFNVLFVWQSPLFMWVFIISRFNKAADVT